MLWVMTSFAFGIGVGVRRSVFAGEGLEARCWPAEDGEPKSRAAPETSTPAQRRWRNGLDTKEFADQIRAMGCTPD